MGQIPNPPLQDRLLALPANISPGWKSLPRINTLAYLVLLSMTKNKSFIKLTYVVKFIRLFSSLTHWLSMANLSSLVTKANGLPYIAGPEICSNLGRPRPGWNVARSKHSSLIVTKKKKFF